MSENEPNSIEASLRQVAAMCAEKRGTNIVALDVRGLVDYMDFLLIVTGRGPRQNRAIAEHVIIQMKREKMLPLSRSGVEGGTWVCVDYVDFVVHIFDQETREHYDLELLWADAEPLELELPEPPPAEETEPAEEGVIEPPSPSTS